MLICKVDRIPAYCLCEARSKIPHIQRKARQGMSAKMVPSDPEHSVAEMRGGLHSLKTFGAPWRGVYGGGGQHLIDEESWRVRV